MKKSKFIFTILKIYFITIYTIYNSAKNINKTDDNIYKKEVYLPIYDMLRPFKFKHEKSKEEIIKSVLNEDNLAQDCNFSNTNDNYICNDSLETLEYESQKNQYMINYLINKELNKDDFKSYFQKQEYNYYGFPNSKYFKETQKTFNRFFFKTNLSLNLQSIFLNNYSDISHKIKFSPNSPIIIEKPICIPSVQLLTIYSNRENIKIVSVLSDMYQVNIFPLIKKTNTNLINEQEKSNFDRNVFPILVTDDNPLVLQLISLPDLIGTLKGNLIIKLSDNTIIFFPVLIKGSENIYKLHPFYEISWSTSTELNHPLIIKNPHNEILYIKEIVNSFNSIKILWPNGKNKYTNSNNMISEDYMEVQSNEESVLLVINFYKEVENIEYGLLQIKTTKDTLIVPVLINVEIKGINIIPKYFSFGIIDVGNDSNSILTKYKRKLYIKISNPTQSDIQIQTINIQNDEKFLSFEIYKNNAYCNVSDNINYNESNAYNNDNITYKDNSSLVFPKLCVIPKTTSEQPFGYIVFDPLMYWKYKEKGHIITNKLIKGNIIIQTDYENNALIKIPYEYYLDQNIFEYVIDKLDQTDKITSNKNYKVIPSIDTKKSTSFKLELIHKLNNSYKIKDYSLNNSKMLSSKLVKQVQLENYIPLYSKEDSNKLDNNSYFKKYIYKLTVNDNYIDRINNYNYYFLKIPTSINLVLTIPIKIENYNIDFMYCNKNDLFLCMQKNNEIKKSINKKSSVVHIKINNYDTHESNKYFFYFINPNYYDSIIDDVIVNNNSIKLKLELYESMDNNDYVNKIANKILLNNNFNSYNYLTEIERTNNRLILLPNSYVAFSFNINSYVEEQFEGFIKFEFKYFLPQSIKNNNNPYKQYAHSIISHTNKFILNFKTSSSKGNFNITPSFLKFDALFPGLRQSKIISVKSTFSNDYKINKVVSSDSRINFEYLNTHILGNKKTEILKITFDPSLINFENNFMKGNYNNFFNTKSLTYKELFLWKHKQQIWEQLGNNGETEILSNISIFTDIKTEVIKIKSLLTKPSLTKKNYIDFGLTQLGEESERYIEIHNPSDEIIAVNLLIAPNDFKDINNFSMFSSSIFYSSASSNLDNASKNLEILDCHMLNSNISPLISLETVSKLNNRIMFKKGLYGTTSKINNISEKNQFQFYLSNNNPNLQTKRIIITDNKNILELSNKEVIDSLYLYSDNLTKNIIDKSDILVCNTNNVNKQDIIFYNDTVLFDNLFSKEFDNDIQIIKDLTDNNYHKIKHQNINYYLNKKSTTEDNGFFNNIISYIKLIIFDEDIDIDEKKDAINNIYNNKNEDSISSLNNQEIKRFDFNKDKQEFFISHENSDKIYFIKPNQKIKLGPIIFSPCDFGSSNSTLFIKNNLTLLYPVQLKGYGGSGILEYFAVYDDYLYCSKNTCDYNKYSLDSNNIIKDKYSIVIDVDTYNLNDLNLKKKITKKILIKNTGNISIKIFKILINNIECGDNDIYINECISFSNYNINNSKNFMFMLRTNEHKLFEITINPNFNYYLIEKTIKFVTSESIINKNNFVFENNGFVFAINIGSRLLDINNQLIDSFIIFNLHKEENVFIAIFVFLAIIIITKRIFELLQTSTTKYIKLELITYDSLINNNLELKIESIYVKAYRRPFEPFQEKFFSELMDKPNTFEATIEENSIVKDKNKTKAKKKIKNIYSKNIGFENLDKENNNITSDSKDIKIANSNLLKKIATSDSNYNSIDFSHKIEDNIKHDKKINIKKVNKRNYSKNKNYITANLTNINNNIENLEEKNSQNNNIYIKTKAVVNNKKVYNKLNQDCNPEEKKSKFAEKAKPNKDVIAIDKIERTLENYSQDSIYTTNNKSNKRKEKIDKIIVNTNSNEENSLKDKININADPYIPKIVKEDTFKSIVDKHNDNLTKLSITPQLSNKHVNNIKDSSPIKLETYDNYVNNYLDLNHHNNYLKNNNIETKKDAYNIINQNSFEEIVINKYDKDINENNVYNLNKNNINNKKKTSEISKKNQQEFVILNENDNIKADKVNELDTVNINNKENEDIEKDVLTNNSDNSFKKNIKNKFNAFNKTGLFEKMKSVDTSNKTLSSNNFNYKFITNNIDNQETENKCPELITEEKDVNENTNLNLNKSADKESDEGQEDMSSHYLSENKQAPWESGTEDFIKNFNFNAIFEYNKTTNNNIKFTSYSLENDMDTKDDGNDDVYRSFSAFKTSSMYGFGTFSLNPFSNDNDAKNNDLLDDLREDDEDDNENEEDDYNTNNDKININNYDVRNNNYIYNEDKLNDDLEEEDDEDDPDWANEDMTIKKDGFFDSDGTYKLKQIDFNFDLSKKFD